MSLARQPLVQFVVTGAAIGLAYGLLGGWSGAGADRTVTTSAAEIARLFGAEFAADVVRRAAREWHGPILSGDGVYLVHIHDRIEAPMPAFEAVG